MKLITDGKVNLNVEVNDLVQAKTILEDMGLTPTELWQLSITVNGCTCYYDDETKQVVQGARWDKTDARYRALAKKQAEREEAALTPTQKMAKNLSGRTKDKPDW